MPSDLTQREYELLHAVRHSIRHFQNFSENTARNAGIDLQQHQLLLVIRANGPINGVPIGVIADRLLLRHNSAVELIDRAVNHGLVVRERTAADRRRVNVRLTPAGREMLTRLASGNLAELRAEAPVLVHALEGLLAEAHIETGVAAL
jgi:DNA-binding MarR family transcriptional regulator